MTIDILPTDTTLETEIPPDAPVETIEVSDTPEIKEELPGYDPKESTRDTVARVLKEQAAPENDGDKSGQEAKSPESALTKDTSRVRTKDGKFTKKGESVAATPAPDAKFDPELYAPDRFKPEAKKAFDAAPPEIKREIHRAIKDLEGGTTRAQQQLHAQYGQAISQIDNVKEILRPFATEWAAKGIPLPQGLGEGLATVSRLANPQTAVQEFLALSQKMGIDLQSLAQAQQNGQLPQPQQQVQLPEEFRVLQEENNQIKSYLVQQQLQNQIAPVVNSARSVMDEVDQSGNFRFPELHDNDYLLSLKPRVSELLGNIPGLTFNDALLKANEERKTKIFGISQSNQPSRLPGNNQQFIAPNGQQRVNAVNAAVSVRGRNAPQAITGDFGEPPPEALKNARATAAWVAKQMSQGRI